MKIWNRVFNYHKLLSTAISVAMVVWVSGIDSIPVKAVNGVKAADAATDLYTLSSGAELASGAYYLSQSKTFGSASTSNNGLKIKSGATVYLYIPKNVTLTAIGGGTTAVRQTGGYAGILLPSSSKLIILGDGTVVANGGNAGNGASGSSGGNGYVDAGSRYYGGSGGAGGYGGGGAGAGIGTNGGTGGSGGSQCSSDGSIYDGDDNYNGNDGANGGTGGTASSCGTLYAQSTITIKATGGSGGTSGGTGGGAGSCDYSSSKWDGKKYHVAGGGGGGGGGAAGYSANGIGTGGAGGGGGGAGGSGGTDYTEDNNYDGPKTDASCNGGGGTRGSGYAVGSSGSGTRDDDKYDGSWGKEGGEGGSGGSAGSGSTAKSALTSGWTDKTYTVTFKDAAGGTVEQMTYTYGEAVATVTVPAYSADLEDGYCFKGWSISNYGVIPDGQAPLTGTDTHTYQPGENIQVGAWLSGSIVLEPVIKVINCKVYFNDNGGSGGPKEALLKSDMTIQPSVNVPTRKGYDFLGYYTGMVSGTKYYDETGARVYQNAIDKGTTKVNLYAQWLAHSSTLTIDVNGGTLDGDTSYTKKYNESITIKDPIDSTDSGKSFLRWVLLDTDTGNSSTNGKLITGAGYTTFIFGADAASVTLKAIWSGANDSRLEVKDGVKQEITCENLDRVFLHVATEAEKGITAEEVVAEEKEVVLTVEEIPVDKESDEGIQDGVQPIETVLEDTSYESLAYYDISVNKFINGEHRGKITELPEIVKITIELTDELAGRSGYSVYRIHEGKVERMSSSRQSEEYYVVGEDAITIHTKKFSTYAITASNSVIGEWAEEELDDTNNFAATDVQGMYVDATSTRIYKVDVEWGAMKFVFNKHQKWNPDNHSYNDEKSILLDESAYVDGNNIIVVTNHSNADVRVGMTVAEQWLEGVDISLKQQNDDVSDEAVDMYLDKVSDASGNGIVSSVNAFVRLGTGTLSQESYEALTAGNMADKFHQIGRVVVTIEAVEDSETTPLY